jgi:hypothetical protein
MSSSELLKNGVEANGILFEVIVPKEPIKVLYNSSKEIPVNFGIHISNTTSENQTFAGYGFVEEIVKLDGRKLAGYFRGINAMRPLSRNDMYFLEPGQSTTMPIHIKANFFWRDGQLYLDGYDTYGMKWAYYPFKTSRHNKYKIRVEYKSWHSTLRIPTLDPPLSWEEYESQVDHGYMDIKNVWTGTVVTPFKEFAVIVRK